MVERSTPLWVCRSDVPGSATVHGCRTHSCVVNSAPPSASDVVSASQVAEIGKSDLSFCYAVRDFIRYSKGAGIVA